MTHATRPWTSQKAGDQRLNGRPALIIRRGGKIDTVIAVRIDNPSTLVFSRPWLRRLLTRSRPIDNRDQERNDESVQSGVDGARGQRMLTATSPL